MDSNGYLKKSTRKVPYEPVPDIPITEGKWKTWYANTILGPIDNNGDPSNVQEHVQADPTTLAAARSLEVKHRIYLLLHDTFIFHVPAVTSAKLF